MKAEQREQPLVSFMWIFKNFFEFTVMSSFMGTSTNSDSYVYFEKLIVQCDNMQSFETLLDIDLDILIELPRFLISRK